MTANRPGMRTAERLLSLDLPQNMVYETLRRELGLAEFEAACVVAFATGLAAAAALATAAAVPHLVPTPAAA